MDSKIISTAAVAAIVAGTSVSIGLAASSGTSHRADAVAGARADARSTASRAASSVRVYDDGVGDVSAAPDISGGNVVANDNVSITFALHVSDRSTFEPFDSYSVFVDADANASTGSAARGGAEFLIDVSGRTSALTVWNGT